MNGVVTIGTTVDMFPPPSSPLPPNIDPDPLLPDPPPLPPELLVENELLSSPPPVQVPAEWDPHAANAIPLIATGVMQHASETGVSDATARRVRLNVMAYPGSTQQCGQRWKAATSHELRHY
jgi:hypothetical protein